ncbi:MAG: phytanoyl-CoA dioxygenase family protein [Armatimonadaceae bacterium]|jgi:hypothetical protein
MLLTDEERDSGRLSPKRLLEALDAFHDCGFLVMENAYARDWIEPVCRACAEGLSEYLREMGGLAALADRTFGVGHIAWFPPLTGLLAEDRLVLHPIARTILQNVLGTGFRSSFHNTNTSFPDSGMQPVHRDHGFLFGNRSVAGQPCAQVVANVCLCDFTIENGGTELWPGTHWITDPLDWESGDLASRACNLASIRLVCPAGTLVLRDLRLWHRGMPNRTSIERSMTATVFQRSWMDDTRTSIPESTWRRWPEDVRTIFRHNPVVDDTAHQPRRWYED